MGPSTSQFIFTSSLPFFKNLGVSGELYQSYGIISQLPWSLKATYAIFCDSVLLFGYHKRSYVVLTSILSTLALLCLGLLTFNTSTAALAAIIFIPIHAQIAIVDLLAEGRFAQTMIQRPETGSELVTLTWGMASFGSFIGALIVGPLADAFDTRYIFLLTLPFAIQGVLPAFLGLFPEVKEPGVVRFKPEKFARYPDLVKLVGVLTLGSLSISLLTFTSVDVQNTFTVLICIVLCAFCFVWTPREMAKIILYIFLSMVFKISLVGALDYFFTADSKCVPNGPQFSMTYYITVVNAIACFAMVIGVALFQRYLSNSTFRFSLVVTNIIFLIASVFDYVIVKRYNLRFGIPDKVFFIMGEAIIVPAATMLELMPCVVLMSKVCPPGIESTVYSILASYQNLGVIVSRSLGVFLIRWCNIRTVYPCDFSGLPKAIVIGHGILPALVFPLVFLLIPKGSMTDDFREIYGSLAETTDEEQAPLIQMGHED